MTELPNECALPVAAQWCDDGEGFVSLFRGCNSMQNWNHWGSMDNQERCYVAARCAMWWRDKWDGGDFDAYVPYRAWVRVWRELEGVKS